MTFTDKNIVENYFSLFESLNSISKLELIEKLTKSIKADTKSKENAFFKSFGAFSTEKSSDEINAEIKKIENSEQEKLNSDEVFT